MENYFAPKLSSEELLSMRNLGLAYVGDAVFEMMVRVWLSSLGNTDAGKMHKAAVSYVSAPAQAKFAAILAEHMTDEESAVYKRGRNAHVGGVPQNSTVGEYHAATGMETLFGYLYLSGKTERLNELFNVIMEEGAKDGT